MFDIGSFKTEKCFYCGGEPRVIDAPGRAGLVIAVCSKCGKTPSKGFWSKFLPHLAVEEWSRETRELNKAKEKTK